MGPPPDMQPLGPRVCYKPAEARERVSTQKLHEPFALMREASAFAHAEALAGSSAIGTTSTSMKSPCCGPTGGSSMYS